MKNIKLSMITIWSILFLISIMFYAMTIANSLMSKNGSILGQTPCCYDRLGKLLCMRQKKADFGKFIYRCMQNADFAFIQCCHTCFDQTDEDPFKLDYQKYSKFLLSNPVTAQCWDRRGANWCEQFAQGTIDETASSKNGFSWERRRQPQLSCSNVPIAFRLCRKTCGYCATDDRPSQVVYDEAMAKNPYLCHNPARGLTKRPKENDFGTRNSVSDSGNFESGTRKVYRDFISRFDGIRKRKMTKEKRKTRQWKKIEEDNWILHPQSKEESMPEIQPIFKILE